MGADAAGVIGRQAAAPSSRRPAAPRRVAEPPRDSPRRARGDRDPGAPRARPFLKWAGGKTQLLPQFRRFYPDTFGAYLEPFLGSGAVFLDLYSGGRLDGHPVWLRDVNVDVVGCYRAVRREVERVIAALAALAEGHRAGGRGHFYEVRDRRFNPTRVELLAAGAPHRRRYPAELAAMLIYLNRTGFNGLFRLNQRGAFNVPMGRYGNPRICDAANLRAVARALGGRDTSIACGSFEAALAVARAGDFIYLDPPYFPLTRTACFTAYTAGGFGPDAHRRLRDAVVQLAERRCHVLLSNSTAAEVQGLYRDDPRVARAGLRTFLVPARRAINSDPSRRRGVLELVVTNLPRRSA